MARILLGVSGGIAAYKALEFTRLAIRAGHSIRAVQTTESLNFVGTASFEGITGAPVLIDQFSRDPLGGAFPDQSRPSHDPISHLELAANCDIYVVAPASANTIAKIAAGLADNMLTALALSCRGPMLVAPAMNGDMFANAATRENIETLRRRGIIVLEPGTGALASRGEFGIGRLPEPAVLLAESERLIAAAADGTGARGLDGVKVLVTAGGTREPIDSVRFVGNRSSGKMGYAIADEASSRGAEVTVIAANVSLDRNPAIRYEAVVTASELERSVRDRFGDSAILVMAAAVADYRPIAPISGKIKKQGRRGIEIALEATDDVLLGLKELRADDQIVVGFAAEAGNELLDEARRKLEAKGLDMIVANDISSPGIGFEVDRNEVTILTSTGGRAVKSRGSKSEVAVAILDEIEALFSSVADPRPRS